jgi:hypothetical protein
MARMVRAKVRFIEIESMARVASWRRRMIWSEKPINPGSGPGRLFRDHALDTLFGRVFCGEALHTSPETL